MKNTNRGFTLIELLVVIAIIGILTSIVMASLSYARKKGADAAIKANLTQLRSTAELYYDEGQHYGVDTADCADATSMFGTTTAQSIIAELQRVSGIAPTCYADDGDDSALGTAANTWAVSSPLKTDPAQSWCVDSTGISASGTASLTTGVAACL